MDIYRTRLKQSAGMMCLASLICLSACQDVEQPQSSGKVERVALPWNPDRSEPISNFLPAPESVTRTTYSEPLTRNERVVPAQDLAKLYDAFQHTRPVKLTASLAVTGYITLESSSGPQVDVALMQDKQVGIIYALLGLRDSGYYRSTIEPDPLFSLLDIKDE